jgi:CRISPR-associated protein Cmr6
MGKMLYTAPMLINLLKQQQQERSSELFQQGTFTLQWRGKVGSFSYPDLETIVSAGEPAGRWKWEPGQDFGQIDQRRKTLPLNGYIPGSSIRGIVRTWAQRQGLRSRMQELLGHQENDKITTGKVEFLDAWPETETKLCLDITNPQEAFQVFHDTEQQGKPLALYTLGDGYKLVTVTIAIRGIAARHVTPQEVTEVWGWVQQALSFYGVGSRTASGYGSLKPYPAIALEMPPHYQNKEFGFTLYSQGCAGPNQGQVELRPSHWRGWLRSWTLRCLLGVMSQTDAQATLEELFGTLQSVQDGKGRQGKVRLEMLKGNSQQSWGDRSSNNPQFYAWKGKLQIVAPEDILEPIILPIIKFAVSVGGVGRGWRRPLHMYMMEKRDRKTSTTYKEKASRGTYLTLLNKTETGIRIFSLPPEAKTWEGTYRLWKKAVQVHYPERFSENTNNLKAEVFSPRTCAVYVVPGVPQEPIDRENLKWHITDTLATRGEGMNLIYQLKYKCKPDVGGNAGSGGAHCSWVSIKRIPVKNEGTKEIVCLFMGDQNQLRSQFLHDLAQIPGAVHLFGVPPHPLNP